MDRTTQVITGAALMMVAALAASATQGLATQGLVIVGQFGVGLTVASMMDATVSRRVLLPALLFWTGEQWWFSASFERPSANRRVK